MRYRLWYSFYRIVFYLRYVLVLDLVIGYLLTIRRLQRAF